MNKITKLFFLPVAGVALIATQASAQITITSADLPTTSTSLINGTDSTSGYKPGSPSSTAQTWNFAPLKAQQSAKVIFMAPAATPYSAKFSSSDNLADSTSGIKAHYYFDNNSSQFSVQGVEEIVNGPYSTSFQVFINLSPEYVQATLPATYGTKLSGVSKGKDEFNPGGLIGTVYDSLKVTTQISYWDTVDAFGTMTTPTGTYQVIRENHWDVTIDSAKGRSSSGSWSTLEASKVTTHEYNWYANGVGYILVQMVMDSTSSTVHYVIWDTTAPAPAGINEISSNGKVSVYPNPCTNQVNFVTIGHDAAYINIFDVTGRKVEAVEMKNNMVNVNTTAFAAGMYLYNMTDVNGNVLDHGKFMVK